MAKDWMGKLASLDGAVNDLGEADVHSTVVQTRSPSLNWLFGNGWGLPLGFSLVIYGPPKSGKSVITYEMAAGIHRDYPDGIVVKFNTEYRERGQLTPQMLAAYGIDKRRYKGIETNHPKEIYDTIATKIDAWCKDGMPIKMIIIDSMNGVQGRRTIENEGGVMVQQIGDVALTNKEGLKEVLAVQRRHHFGLVMTSHVAVEMDPIEQKRGNKFKMGASIGVQHHAEYFMFVDPNRNAPGRLDLLGNSLANEDLKGLDGKGEKQAHKIRCVMKDSSMGPKGRFGEFTFNYRDGIINTWEEVFLLGNNRGIFSKTSNHVWSIPGTPYIDVAKGEANFQKWFRDEPKAQEAVLKALKLQDITGAAAKFDARDEATYASPEVPETDEEIEARIKAAEAAQAQA
jgi:hypothetical protein